MSMTSNCPRKYWPTTASHSCSTANTASRVRGGNSSCHLAVKAMPVKQTVKGQHRNQEEKTQHGK